jgi:hypothetical protein
MAAVSIFLEEYDDVPDNDFLNKIICQWRRAEEETRKTCGLASVSTHYPGCYFNQREASKRRLKTETSALKSHPKSAGDLLLQNIVYPASAQRTILIEDDFDDVRTISNDRYISDSSQGGDGRHLMDYDHVGPWFNYFPMLEVKTEYYYRYSGTQTVPPCYGRWFAGNNRRQTNHWRVMKDPIRVSPRQIEEMHRLLRERIAPSDDPLRPCEPDTAAKQNPNSTRISVARPLQSTRGTHFKVFCQCDDWVSKFPEDQKWCEMSKLDRLYRHPYNFETDGF